jgi:hypothetical protein
MKKRIVNLSFKNGLSTYSHTTKFKAIFGIPFYQKVGIKIQEAPLNL